MFNNNKLTSCICSSFIIVFFGTFFMPGITTYLNNQPIQNHIFSTLLHVYHMIPNSPQKAGSHTIIEHYKASSSLCGCSRTVA